MEEVFDLFLSPVVHCMEIVIGNVLFKALVKGTQGKSYSTSTNVRQKTEISVSHNALSSEKRHNLPGTPVERLSLNTTVMLIMI